MRALSPGASTTSSLRRRVRVEGFFSRMWLRIARRRRSLPVPVALKRLAAPRWVFIFGIWDFLRRPPHRATGWRSGLGGWFGDGLRCDLDLGFGFGGCRLEIG